jgi:hypothetical protein
MFFNEARHEGRPHFHAVYAGDRASFDIVDLTRLDGKLPARTERLVRTWAQMNRAELLANWERGRQKEEFETIEPLK